MEGPSIHQRMLSIIEELPAIGKTQRNAQQGFMFRGHDDVMNELTPLLAKHGVFFVPRVLERLTDQRKTTRGGVMYEVNLHVEYTFYGANGDSFRASAWGEGTDSGDKSTNKAMTMALKNVVAQSFAINTAEAAAYDADKHTPEETVWQDRQGASAAPAAPAQDAPRARGPRPIKAQKEAYAAKLEQLSRIAPDDGEGKPVNWIEWGKDLVPKKFPGYTLDGLDKAQFNQLLDIIDGVIEKVEERVDPTFERTVDEGAVADAVAEAGEEPPAEVDIPFGEPA
jgi:hypothetical protein